MEIDVRLGDCNDVLGALGSEVADLAYLDPPFFTQREHRLTSRDRSQEYSFADLWDSLSHYGDSLLTRLRQVHRVVKPTGSIFFHCDKTASPVARAVLDNVFGDQNFRSEIIWHYRRWSNGARNLLPAHQTILFYSKTSDYKFNTILTDYSPTTNVDQLLQRRSRDGSNKSVYARDENGEIVYGGAKEGVPLSDVWSIPFLNPKARERSGYPTQKPLLLLERIISLVTEPGDVVLDPFCGSGTTLVAAKMMGRRAIGIDISEEAISLTKARLAQPVKTNSDLLRKGLDAYLNADPNTLALLNGVPHIPVQRNSGIDAILKATFQGVPIPVRIQRKGESLSCAAAAVMKAAQSKNARRMIVVATNRQPELIEKSLIPDCITIIDSTALQLNTWVEDLQDSSAEYNRCATQTDSTTIAHSGQRP